MARRVVNVSGEDRKAAAAANDFEPIPAGWYNGTIFNAEEKQFKNAGKHPGDDYYNVQLRVSEGDYKGRVLFVMVPLFPKWNPGPKTPNGFPTNFIPFFEALGEDLEGEFEVPDPDELGGQDITFRVRIEEDAYKNAKEGTTDAKRNEVTAFRPYDPDDDPSPTREDVAPATKPARRRPKAEDGWDV